MGKWRISFHAPPSLRSEKKRPGPEPPSEFVCPISGSLMADPVVVPSGHSFEHACVQACHSLSFTPTTLLDSNPDFTTVIPNLALKSAILTWCHKFAVEPPKPPTPASAETHVRRLMASSDPIAGVSDRPPVKLTHASTELTPRRTHYPLGSGSSSSSSSESVSIASSTTPLQLATRPSCLSSSSSSSEIEHLFSNANPNSKSKSIEEEEEVLAKLKSPQVFEQEEGVQALRKLTRTRPQARVSLCTAGALSALRSLIVSRYASVQVHAVAALVNMSLARDNKVRIVRSGMVPPLIDVLRGGSPESQEHASGALFSLALDDANKTAIGVLGALPPLLHVLRSGSERAQHDSALALYHLSLVRTNRVKLVKLGAVQTLLGMVESGHMPGRALLVLCNLAAGAEGRAAMLEAGAVECFVGFLRRGPDPGSESTRESCVAALYSLSHGGLRFKVVAKAAGLEEAMRRVERDGSERAKERARRMLESMRRKEEDGGGGDVNWEALLGLDLPSRTPSRRGSGLIPKSTQF